MSVTMPAIEAHPIEHLDVHWRCETTFELEPPDDNRCDEQAVWFCTKNCCDGTDKVCDDCLNADAEDDDDWVECDKCGTRFPDMRRLVRSAIRIES